MFVQGEHVVSIGQKSPVGIVELVEDETVYVLWGIADNCRYEDVFHISELQHAENSSEKQSL